jgi:hypothetical protein
MTHATRPAIDAGSGKVRTPMHLFCISCKSVIACVYNSMYSKQSSHPCAAVSPAAEPTVHLLAHSRLSSWVDVQAHRPCTRLCAGGSSASRGRLRLQYRTRGCLRHQLSAQVADIRYMVREFPFVYGLNSRVPKRMCTQINEHWS